MGSIDDALPLKLSHGAVVSAKAGVLIDEVPATSTASEHAHGSLVLGFRSDSPASLLDLRLGQLKAGRMLACARCKLWWMTPEWRTSTLSLPPETQFLLVEMHGQQAGAQGPAEAFALLLPLIDGDFRATLRAGSGEGAREGSITLRIESGDKRVRAASWRNALYIAAGSDPFQLIDRGVAAAAQLSGTALPRTQKQLPPSLDYFGWCTWDAFYSTVSARGIQEGLVALNKGGIRPRMLIIDDGWQSTDVDPEFRKPSEPQNASGSGSETAVAPSTGTSGSPASANGNGTQPWWSQAGDRVKGWLLGAGTTLFLLYYQGIVEPAAPGSWAESSFAWLAQGVLRPQLLGFFAEATDFTRRLTSVKANGKFSHPDAGPTDAAAVGPADSSAREGLGSVVKSIKQQFGVDFVYCWHGLPAYWSGVMPGALEMQAFHPTLMFGQASPGVLEVEPSMAWNPAALAGVGVIKEPGKLYNAMHGYLSSCGVDGVKVDCQAGLGLVGSALGGGAAVSRKFHAALEQSVSTNFPGNHCINCMCHSTENLYHMAHTSVARASDDFFPRDAASSHPHIAACSFNGLFMSALVQPDWDMFHSRHSSAQLHAMARAISGGGVYVSDKPGEHDFELLRRLVLPDGSVLRALQPARPTRDCLFRDVLRDDASLLKLWTRNAYTGVVGVFHLQGASWDRSRRKFLIHNKAPRALSTQVLAKDIEGLPHAKQYAVYAYSRQQLSVHSREEPLVVTLHASSSDLITVSPVLEVSGLRFAPIGLCHMYNGGGAVLSCNAQCVGESTTVHVEVRGCGSFLAFCSKPPSAVTVAQLSLFFSYDSSSAALRVDVPATLDLRCKLSIVFSV